jgi:hypothetical protein
MAKEKAAEKGKSWQDRELPRTFEEKAYRLQQAFINWVDGNPDRLRFREDGDWITTRMVELLLLEKAAECSSRRRVDSMRLVATDMMVKVVEDPATLKEIEAKIDELFKELEAYDEMGLNDPRYQARIQALAERLTGKNGKQKGE